MSVWSETTLNGLIHIKHGYAFLGEYFSDRGEYVVLTPGNFFEKGGFRFREGKEKFYLGEIPESFILKKHDLIVAMTEQGEGLLGSTAFIPENNKYLHNQRLGLIDILDTERLDKTFLYYLMNHQYIRSQIRNTSTGTKVRHTSPKSIYNVKVFLPSILEQKKIAAILSAYDDLIENNKKRIQILENMAEELYKEWFVRFRFPNWENTEFEKGVPRDWVEQTVNDSFAVLGGGTPSKEVDEYWVDGEINWYTPSDLTRQDSLFIENSELKCNETGLNKSSAKLFPPYSIMMTSRATIGVLSINTTEACTNQGFITCIPNKEFPLTYLYFWLKFAKPYLEILASGATFAELSRGNFKKVKLFKPNDLLVESFENQCRPIFDEVLTLQKQNRLLGEQKDSLLPRLISGKLSLEDLDIQFPPSMQEQ